MKAGVILTLLADQQHAQHLVITRYLASNYCGHVAFGRTSNEGDFGACYVIWKVFGHDNTCPYPVEALL